MVEENPGVMVAQSRGPRGSERSHFLPLALPGPWSTLTHCEISDRSCLPSGLGFHSLYSEESGLNGSPRSYLAILTSWWLCTHAVSHHASHHHTLPVSQEGRGLLRTPSPIRQKLWHWGLTQGLTERFWAIYWCLSQCWNGQVCSGHIACPTAISWGRLVSVNIVSGPGSAVLSKNRCNS